MSRKETLPNREPLAGAERAGGRVEKKKEIPSRWQSSSGRQGIKESPCRAEKKPMQGGKESVQGRRVAQHASAQKQGGKNKKL